MSLGLAAGAPAAAQMPPSPAEIARYDGTALVAAAHLGHDGVLRQLIAAGANTQLADRSGRTPLQLARDRGYAPMVQFLLKAGAR